jgi:hypothetical protein
MEEQLIQPQANAFVLLALPGTDQWVEGLLLSSVITDDKVWQVRIDCGQSRPVTLQLPPWEVVH